MGDYKGRVQLRQRKRRFAKNQRIKALAATKKGTTAPSSPSVLYVSSRMRQATTKQAWRGLFRDRPLCHFRQANIDRISEYCGKRELDLPAVRWSLNEEKWRVKFVQASISKSKSIQW
jgi:hypothetical protein